MLGHLDRLARWGSRTAPASNFLARSAAVRRLNERALGLDRRRVPPEFVRQTFRRRFRKLRAGNAGAVALFVDTFTNHYHPEIGLAAADVLTRLDYDVELAPNLCCGRPLISQGLLGDARRRASENAQLLQSIVDNGRTLVFLEPSCLSAVREDAPDLLSGEDRRRARDVAAQSSLFEEWLEREASAGRARLQLRPGPASVLLHGHCHQKAMGALAPAKALLSRIPGTTIIDPDAGCCGMAGSFGYMKDHYDVSRAIAERRLLPAVRAHRSDGVVVASGTSCRQQIADFGGVRALHAAELVQNLLTRRS